MECKNLVKLMVVILSILHQTRCSDHSKNISENGSYKKDNVTRIRIPLMKKLKLKWLSDQTPEADISLRPELGKINALYQQMISQSNDISSKMQRTEDTKKEGYEEMKIPRKEDTKKEKKIPRKEDTKKERDEEREMSRKENTKEGRHEERKRPRKYNAKRAQMKRNRQAQRVTSRGRKAFRTPRIKSLNPKSSGQERSKFKRGTYQRHILRNTLPAFSNNNYYGANQFDDSDFYSILFSEDEPESHQFHNTQSQYWGKPLYQRHGPPYDHYDNNYFLRSPQFKLVPPPPPRHFNQFVRPAPPISNFHLSDYQFLNRSRSPTQGIEDSLASLFDKLLQQRTKQPSTSVDKRPPSLFIRNMMKNKVKPERFSNAMSRQEDKPHSTMEPYFEVSQEDIQYERNEKIIKKKRRMKTITSISHAYKQRQPSYSSIPKTSFTCEDRRPGMYVDTEADCQVWHTCESNARHHSFLCPNGTAFSQSLLTCDWWYKVDCHTSEVFEPMKLEKEMTSSEEQYKKGKQLNKDEQIDKGGNKINQQMAEEYMKINQQIQINQEDMEINQQLDKEDENINQQMNERYKQIDEEDNKINEEEIEINKGEQLNTDQRMINDDVGSEELFSTLEESAEISTEKKPLFQEFVPYEGDQYPMFRLLSTRKFSKF